MVAHADSAPRILDYISPARGFLIHKTTCHHWSFRELTATNGIIDSLRHIMDVAFILIAIAAIVIGVGIYLVVGYSRRRKEKYRTFAENLGLEVVKGRWTEQPKLLGAYAGKNVQIQDIVHSTGKSVYFTHVVTLESAYSSPERVSINLSRHGAITNFFLNIGKIFGYRTVAFDNAELDSAVIVRASNHDFARALLDAELEQDIYDVRKGTVNIKGNLIAFEEYGQAQDNENRIRQVLAFLDKLERKLARLGASHSEKYDKRGLSAF